MALEDEKVFYSTDPQLVYERRLFTGDINCKIVGNTSFNLRGFSGHLLAKNSDSSTVQFNPQDVSEARLRIDQPRLSKVRRIDTLGGDLILPFPIPLPSSLLAVNRQIRLLAFTDYGKSQDPDLVYRDAGLGFWIPFGGDVVGKGSVQLVNLSVLGVLFRQVGDEKSQQPGVVFDFGFGAR